MNFACRVNNSICGTGTVRSLVKGGSGSTNRGHLGFISRAFGCCSISAGNSLVLIGSPATLTTLGTGAGCDSFFSRCKVMDSGFVRSTSCLHLGALAMNCAFPGG